MATERYAIGHFSQANPVGPGQDNVPALLRRVADSVEQLGEVEVQDIVLHTEINEYGYWHSLTVYYDESDQPQDESGWWRPRCRPSAAR